MLITVLGYYEMIKYAKKNDEAGARKQASGDVRGVGNESSGRWLGM